MNTITLREEIEDLIGLRIEGDYWDFKEQWHENNADLLHDIICMANNTANRDAYIIIGVSDSKSANGVQIKGVPAAFRKSQQNLIDFLKDKPFAGGIRPTVYVETIIIEYEIDVIIVKNTINVPYYLTAPFKYGKECVQSGHIYVRVGDTNTPKKMCADTDKVEYLWRKHFGIDLSALQRLSILLDDPDSWEGDLNSSDYKYHSLFPEYQIRLVDSDEDFENNSIVRNLADHNPDTSFEAKKLLIYYHSTVLFSEYVLYLDGYRHLIPFPETHTVYLHGEHDLKKSLSYLYFDSSTIVGKLFKCLSQAENHWYKEKWDMIVGVGFLQFTDPEDKNRFDNFVSCNLRRTLEEYEQALIAKGYTSTVETSSFYIFGWSKANEIIARYLFEKYRGTNGRELIQYLPTL